MIRSLLSAGFALGFLLPASAADWPRFRGPNGTGIVSGTLPEVNPAGALWKVALPGRGISSPIVVGGKLFIQSASDDGSKRMLLCIDAATGKTLWSRDQFGAKAKTHNKNSLASATPACDGERVYCTVWDGENQRLLAYDLDGKELWHQPLGGFVSQHGPANSPSVYKGIVFVNIDEDANLGGKAILSAFDAKTGQLKWSVPRKPYRACYTVPFLLERPNHPAVLVLGTTTAITGYEPATGKVLWSHVIEWPSGTMPLRMVGSPVYADGAIVCSCGDGSGARHAIAIDPDGKQPTRLWEIPKGPTPYVPCMIAQGNLVYWIADNGIPGCAEARTGKMLWNEDRLSQKDVTASPILVGSEILTITEAGKVFVLKADPKFELIRESDLREPVFASPALADGKLFIRGSKHLYCFGKKKA